MESIGWFRAKITSVLLRDHAGQLGVSGRGPIPGHLHVEAIAADGEVLAETV